MNIYLSYECMYRKTNYFNVPENKLSIIIRDANYMNIFVHQCYRKETYIIMCHNNIINA